MLQLIRPLESTRFNECEEVQNLVLVQHVGQPVRYRRCIERRLFFDVTLPTHRHATLRQQVWILNHEVVIGGIRVREDSFHWLTRSREEICDNDQHSLGYARVVGCLQVHLAVEMRLGSVRCRFLEDQFLRRLLEQLCNVELRVSFLLLLRKEPGIAVQIA